MLSWSESHVIMTIPAILGLQLALENVDKTGIDFYCFLQKVHF